MAEPDVSSRVLADLSKCFRMTLDTLPVEKKTRVAKQLVKVLKEESGERVFAYETAFFVGSDLKHIDVSGSEIVKQHVIARLGNRPTEELLHALDGIGEFLTEPEVTRVGYGLLKTIVYGNDESLYPVAEYIFPRLFWQLSEDTHRDLLKRQLERWTETARKKNIHTAVEILKRISAAMEEEQIPF